jgi:hypothetical protein
MTIELLETFSMCAMTPPVSPLLISESPPRESMVRRLWRPSITGPQEAVAKSLCSSFTMGWVTYFGSQAGNSAGTHHAPLPDPDPLQKFFINP